MPNHVRLIYRGRLKALKKAVKKANEILGKTEFYEQIKGYESFGGSGLSPKILVKLMQESNHEIYVDVGFLIPFANAATNSSTKIKVSYWNFSKELSVGVNTLIHETVNALDYLHNSSNEKKQPANNEDATAPWVVGVIAEIMVDRHGAS
jgi:hypothetical protein